MSRKLANPITKNASKLRTDHSRKVENKIKEVVVVGEFGAIVRDTGEVL
jgi:hypothetical protein